MKANSMVYRVFPIFESIVLSHNTSHCNKASRTKASPSVPAETVQLLEIILAGYLSQSERDRPKDGKKEEKEKESESRPATAEVANINTDVHQAIRIFFFQARNIVTMSMIQGNKKINRI